MRTSLTVFAVLGVVLGGCGGFGSGNYGEEPPPPALEAKPPVPQAPPLEGTPREEELTERFGLFVARHGAADGDGSRQKPLASISQAIIKGKETGKRVYVCAGTYQETVTLERGVPVAGGLDCSTFEWKTSGQKTRVEAPSSPAMIAKGIDIRTRVEGFDVIAPNGKPGAPSSIALHAETSPGLYIARSKLVAGRGSDGANGTDGIQLTLDPAANGVSSKVESSGPSYIYIQPIAARNGEVGGVGMCNGALNHHGEAGGSGGRGGTYTCKAMNIAGGGVVYQWETLFAITGGAAKTAADGASGADGASASAIGALSVNGYAPANGDAGSDGEPGKGGSGGTGGSMSSFFCSSGYVAWGATGAGGGAGGCPGLAGTPGEGGGASIGALLVSSAGLTFDATEIEANEGGKGGKGSFGSSATAGGAAGTNLGMSTPAQAGGAGGRSGVSGSGAGGPTFGVAHTGGEPVFLAGGRAKAGKAGAGVPSETITDANGAEKTLAASADGVAADAHAF